MKERVVITKMSCVTPFGYNPLNYINKPFNTTINKIKIGTEKYLEINTYIVNEKFLKKLEKETYTNNKTLMFTRATTKQILKDLNSDNIGVAISNTLPSLSVCEDIFTKYYNKEPNKLRVGHSLIGLNHTPASDTSIFNSLDGRCISPAASCAGGLQSIALAYETIANGYENMMICGGIEEYHPFLSLLFHKLGILSNNCKPFQTDRDGTVIGEGAGIFLLENYKTAKKNNREILGEILGVGINNSNNYISPDSNFIYKCMNKAFINAKNTAYAISIEGFTIDTIITHGTGTILGDSKEIEAIKNFCNINYLRPSITALKGYLGHNMSASGPIELITYIKALKELKVKLGIFNNIEELKKFDFTDINFDIIHQKNTTYKPIILKNSFGLGGTNTSIVIQVNV